ncbi:MAG: metallophosphoesterase [Myxococcota bacterium]|nr:metallophosphoesterase [Myxococcota bacterium]
MLLLHFILACEEGSKDGVSQDSVDTPYEPEYQFSVLLIADPHLEGGVEHQNRLEKTVDWIEMRAEDYAIEMVIVLGDIGWGDGLEQSQRELERLSMPYVPIIGDNEIHFGDQFRFFDVFESRYRSLADEMDDWNDSFEPAFNPEYAEMHLFYNFAFSFRGIRFVALDWSSRSTSPILGEMGDLHHFDGGTYPWFEEEVRVWEQEPNSVFMITHIPMYMNAGAFDIAEMAQVEAVLAPYSDAIYANFAGHLHSDVQRELSLYSLYVLDAVWDDEISLRQVDVYRDQEKFIYTNTIHVVD